MSYSIDATIEELSDQYYTSIVVTFSEETSWMALGLITGIQISRIKAFVILGLSSRITLSMDEISIQLSDRRITKHLTHDMYEAITCCFFDKAFNIYPHPHVDIEFNDLGITFQWP